MSEKFGCGKPCGSAPLSDKGRTIGCPHFHKRSGIFVANLLIFFDASLLWRFRRATVIETDLLQIQAEILRERQQARDPNSEAQSNVYRLLKTMRPSQGEYWEDSCGHCDDQPNTTDDQCDPLDGAPNASVGPSRELTYCFMRLANIDNGLFERL